MPPTSSHIKKLRLGTRGSPLALTQAKMVKAKVETLHPEIEVEIVIIKTTGDWTPEQGDTRLSDIQSTGQWAGKGLFAKEIQESIINDTIDAAVHSMKDMETHIPDGLTIRHMLPRADPRDALILGESAKNSTNIETLPRDCKVGTSSLRRASFLKNKRWDIQIVPLRGNVHTRIEKLEHRQVDAVFLACAGLDRLDLSDKIGFRIAPEDILPSAGQGAIGIETTEFNKELLAIFDPISCKKTVLCVSAERAALKELDGSCSSPIGAYATLNDGGMLHLRIAVGEEEGHGYWFEERRATATTNEEAIAYGKELGRVLKDRIPEGIL